jgi:hypothetical protein
MSGKQKYLQGFRDRLSELYLQIRDYDNRDVAMCQGIEAFMEAGILSGVVNHSELQSVIADEHMSVFGMTRQERLQMLREEALGKGDYAFFDTPTWQRDRK